MDDGVGRGERGSDHRGGDLSATPGHLLTLIRSRAAWTRQQLLATTGMSRPTLLDRLAPLFRAGLVHESGAAASIGGRPAQLIRFDDRRMVVLTFDIGHLHGRVSITGVHGRELRSVSLPIQISPTPPAESLDRLIALATELLPPGGAERLIGIGVGLPGPISPTTGLPGPTPILPGWDRHPVVEVLRTRWPVPVVLENDARALALGEATVQGVHTLIGVKWSNGIGAGLVTGGSSLAGDDGAAGDIGHIKLGAGGPRCRCGRRGCLAAYASGHALLGQLRPHGVESLDELTRLAEAGDPRVTAALTTAAGQVGTVLAALIALTNPRKLVLGGAIGALPRVVECVDAQVRTVAMHHSTESLQVVRSQLGERAATAGLVHLVVDRVLSPESVNRVLSTGDSVFGPPA